jgi:hypothetical protein
MNTPNTDDDIVQAWAKEGRTPEQIHGVKNFLTSRHFKQLITDAKVETEKAYGGCRKCYGKGYATVRKGEETMNRHYKYLNIPVHNQVNFCSCDRGKQLYDVFGYPQTKELKENN